MEKTAQFWLLLFVGLFSGLDAIMKNINNLTEGFTSWWNSLIPIIQLIAAIALVWLIFKKIMGSTYLLV